MKFCESFSLLVNFTVLCILKLNSERKLLFRSYSFIVSSFSKASFPFKFVTLREIHLKRDGIKVWIRAAQHVFYATVFVSLFETHRYHVIFTINIRNGGGYFQFSILLLEQMVIELFV